MAATFEWNEDHGAATGSPAKGATRSTAVTEVNWKNIDDSTTAYTAAPITAGNNSYEKWQFGKFTGQWNQISAGLFAHTAGTLLTGTPIKGPPACTGDASRLLYTTPSTTANANLTHAFHDAGGLIPVAITSGVAVAFGITGPEATGKGTSVSGGGTAYTNYLTTQMQTTGAAGAGNTEPVTLTLRYDEN